MRGGRRRLGPRRALVVGAALFALASSVTSCALVFPFDDLVGDGNVAPEAPDGTSPDRDDPITDDDGAVVDGGSGDAIADVVVTGRCGDAGTEGMIRIEAADGAAPFCIDPKEVTNKEYQAMLDDNPTFGMPPACRGWKIGHTPTTTPSWPLPPTYDDYPVHDVDWCDAWVYCKWANKHLCGRIGGGIYAAAEVTNPLASQWTYACSNGESKRAFPYGTTYDATACNVGATDAGPMPASSHPDCVGGFPGIYDLSGNVEEWDGFCNDAVVDAGRDDVCPVRGGSAIGTADASQYACTSAVNRRRDMRARALGFRCCSF